MMLTDPQRDLFIWMVQTGESSSLLEGMFGPHDALVAGPGGERRDRDVDASDLRELVGEVVEKVVENSSRDSAPVTAEFTGEVKGVQEGIDSALWASPLHTRAGARRGKVRSG